MSTYEILFSSFAFILGASIGSFLNVCIYRMPRDLSISDPKRSFCPNCKYQIPWYRNLPLISWLSLRGKCANCGAPIAFRYFLVELLTGLLFLAVWLKVWPHAWILALPYWVMIALFVVATFIDFEHIIIPDEITWGGAAAGVVLSLAIPTLHGVKSPLEGGMWAVAGAALGYFLIWGIVVGGKKAFGRKRIKFKEPAGIKWRREGDVATLETENKAEPWAEFFPDEKAVMRMKCALFEIDGKKFEDVEVSSTYEKLTVAGCDYDLNKIEVFSGLLREVFFERDAMGFGDVKFMACIGAFLGWKAVLFTVMAASTIGALVGVCTILMGRREWSAKIPFGPYLSLGALIWLFYGPALVAGYWALTHPPDL